MAEPEWDEATRDLALALDDVDICPACGGPAYLCQDPANQYAYEVSAPIRCHARTAVLERQKGVTEETNPHSTALLWSVRLTNGGSRG